MMSRYLAICATWTEFSAPNVREHTCRWPRTASGGATASWPARCWRSAAAACSAAGTPRARCTAASSAATARTPTTGPPPPPAARTPHPPSPRTAAGAHFRLFYSWSVTTMCMKSILLVVTGRYICRGTGGTKYIAMSAQWCVY